MANCPNTPTWGARIEGLQEVEPGYRVINLTSPLIFQAFHSLRVRYVSDWTVFNQPVVASAVYAFFTNLLPGITFASDLYVLTGKSWGVIEVVVSTGLCRVILILWVPILNPVKQGIHTDGEGPETYPWRTRNRSLGYQR